MNGVSPHRERDGEPHTEHVDDHSDDHHLERKGIFPRRRKRHDDAIHEKVDGHPIQNARKYGMVYEEAHTSAHRKVDRGSSEGDNKVAEKDPVPPLQVLPREIAAPAIPRRSLATGESA